VGAGGSGAGLLVAALCLRGRRVTRGRGSRASSAGG
jgi:hypothetical protein